ncbi:MAG TPA: DUF2332 domain-containing protein [Parvularculaceae bacterium]|nr:DUF2332 domain-containing protein [Parvularculaceae bacterium]
MRQRLKDIAAAFRWQAKYCRNFKAPFTAAIIDAAAQDIEDGGPLGDLLNDWSGDPLAGALSLRVAAAAQYLARRAADGALVDLYRRMPSDPEPLALASLISQIIAENRSLFKEFTDKPVQTNEVRRSAGLLGGFLEIGQRLAMPLDLYEIGSSGGLLMGWDRFRYDFGEFSWGDPGAPALMAEWRGPRPDWPESVSVASRRGCDINPVDLDDRGAAERAACYFWAEQEDRRARFLSAVEATRGIGATVEKADAATWLRASLKSRPERKAAVIFQSTMMQYLTPDERTTLRNTIADIATTATPADPIAHLRFEPDPIDLSQFAVDLTMWPGGDRRRLAYAHPHAEWVEWLGAD